MKRNMPYTKIMGYFEHKGQKLPITRNVYPFGDSGWRFTNKEIMSIRNAFYSPKRRKLRVSANEKNIDLFIVHLQQFCSAKKYWILDRPKRAAVREKRESVLTDCKAALGHLKLIHECKINLCLYNDLEVFEGEKDDPVSAFRLQSWEEAEAALKALDKFTTTLDEYHLSETKKQGRDRADSDNLIKVVRDLYITHIGEMPKSHKTSAFTDIVKAVYSILGLPSEDPSRAITAALKAK
ncbi:MAG TPA: hypothetical protein PLK94_10145 [Alphaproteobacteria bacterium]|nr:hypothetical protein [Alphaproteobacteria bacterium]